MILTKCHYCKCDFYLTDSDIGKVSVNCPTCERIIMLVTKCPVCNKQFTITEDSLNRDIIDCSHCGHKAAWDRKTGFDIRFPYVQIEGTITPPVNEV